MTKLLGIDVSEHNGVVNWEKIKASGVKFAMLRASWGHFAEDKQLRRNVAECKRVGMPFGLYHYSYADNEANARMEATRFLALARELGGYTYPLNLDMEDADGWKANNGVGDDMNIKTIRIFKEVIEGAGEYLTLYMSKSWFDRLRAKDGALIDSLDAWLAHWGIAEPSMPCGMWQYTSDGKVNGSSARTDMNYAYRDYPSILGKKPSKPSKPTSPKPVGTKYKVGDVVNINGIYTSKDSTTKLRPAVSGGQITKIYEGANNPYLIGNGTGFVNDSCITGKKGGSTSPIKVGDKVRPKTAVSYEGVKLIPEVTRRKYTVIEVKGNRVVLGDGLNTAFNINNLSK